MLPLLLLWLSLMFLNKEKMKSPAWQRIDKKMKKSNRGIGQWGVKFPSQSLKAHEIVDSVPKKINFSKTWS